MFQPLYCIFCLAFRKICTFVHLHLPYGLTVQHFGKEDKLSLCCVVAWSPVFALHAFNCLYDSIPYVEHVLRVTIDARFTCKSKLAVE